jgi:hypothetical protein
LFSLAYRQRMSTKRVRTVADLVRFSCGLRIDCGSCGNSRTLDGFGVARALGTGSLETITRRLKCSRCGAKESRVSVLSPPPPRN